MPRFKARKPDEGSRLKASQGDDDMDTAARVLALAQRTADQAVEDAKAEAERILEQARQQAEQILDDARTRAQGS